MNDSFVQFQTADFDGVIKGRCNLPASRTGRGPENQNGRCSTDCLTRLFRKTSFRCTKRSSSWKELPVPDFSSGNAERRLVSFDRLQLPNQRTKLLTPSVAFAGVQILVNYSDRVLRYAG